MSTQYNLFFDEAIFDSFIACLEEVREELIISTANFKDMRLCLTGEWYRLWKETGDNGESGITRAKNGKKYIPLIPIIKGLRKKGVRVMILASSEGNSVRRRIGHSSDDDWLKVCPRNHQKFMLVDGERGFLTSANLTGSGMGLRHPARRNFESAIMLTSSQVGLLRGNFLHIWDGKHCSICRYAKKRTCQSYSPARSFPPRGTEAASTMKPGWMRRI